MLSRVPGLRVKTAQFKNNSQKIFAEGGSTCQGDCRHEHRAAAFGAPVAAARKSLFRTWIAG
jgi:hypothetical protein